MQILLLVFSLLDGQPYPAPAPAREVIHFSTMAACKEKQESINVSAVMSATCTDRKSNSLTGAGGPVPN